MILLMTILHATIGSFVIYIVLNDLFGPAEPTKFIDGLFKCGKKDESKNTGAHDLALAKDDFEDKVIVLSNIAKPRVDYDLGKNLTKEDIENKKYILAEITDESQTEYDLGNNLTHDDEIKSVLADVSEPQVEYDLGRSLTHDEEIKSVLADLFEPQVEYDLGRSLTKDDVKAIKSDLADVSEPQVEYDLGNNLTKEDVEENKSVHGNSLSPK